MTGQIVKYDNKTLVSQEKAREYITVKIEGQLFGISVDMVQDVFRPQKITDVPLSPREIVGVLNLRGKILAIVDLNLRLGQQQAAKEKEKAMCVVLEYNSEFYGLMVEGVGDVMHLQPSLIERNPANLKPAWGAFASGVYQLDKGLLVILNVELLLNFET